jgi:renalase
MNYKRKFACRVVLMTSKTKSKPTVAVIGAGMAGVTAARTLQQAGHRVVLFDKSAGFGGRMATRRSEFGSFDHGAQYFTVRDARFRTMMQWALATAPDIARPWSANAVRVLDAAGQVAAAALPKAEPHWVAQPGMNALVAHCAKALLDAGHVMQSTRVHRISHGATGWQLNAVDAHDQDAVYTGFDKVILAIPSFQARELLHNSQQHAAWVKALDEVKVDPCWTLMLAFPNALPLSPREPTRPLGPQWSAARSTHHRVAWLARESSKPNREPLERWTVQASAAWSHEHLEDDGARVQAKLLKAFAEVTGIRAEPEYAQVHRWRFAKTAVPLGKNFLWDKKSGLGVCGDWCIGHRVEDAFISGLELALAAK